MDTELSSRAAILLFAVVIFAWGINWPVTQIIVQSVPPIWTNAIRCWIAFFVLLPVLWVRRQLIVPKVGDVPVILSIALLHMAAFSTLAAAGQQFVPASKAVVLGYTTPIWVAIAAPVLLREKITIWRLIGITMGLGGIAVIFNPETFDWSDRETVIGCALVMLAAVCWAASIVYVRSHKWLATPFQLLLWQVLLAAVVLSVTAVILEGIPHIIWTRPLWLQFAYGSLVGTVLAYWAMSVINRRLPAITTSLGVLMTPLVGIACASLILGEVISLSLIIAATLIVGGIALGTLADEFLRKRSRRRQSRVQTNPRSIFMKRENEFSKCSPRDEL